MSWVKLNARPWRIDETRKARLKAVRGVVTSRIREDKSVPPEVREYFEVAPPAEAVEEGIPRFDDSK
jgi:hypothetical protein